MRTENAASPGTPVEAPELDGRSRPTGQTSLRGAFAPCRFRLPACLVALSVITPGTVIGEEIGQSNPQSEPPPVSKSGYERLFTLGGSSSVSQQLVEDDKATRSVFPVSILHDNYYEFKQRLRARTGIELNIDYNFLNQTASFAENGDRRGASGALRFYGRWYPLLKHGDPNGSLVFRFENRHQIADQTPKELGFETGSSLSTAGFKEFGWGVTALYWAQQTTAGRLAFVAGQMDPGDFEDIHPLLNPWTAFTNDASFNNPTTALPNQGLGVVGRAFVTPTVYLKGGVHDANGSPNDIDFDSFFRVREYFTWAEVGWSPTPEKEAAGESIHLTLWHSDRREDPANPVEAGHGVAFSAAHQYGDRWIPFMRAGYSRGGGANLSAMVSAGAGIRVRSDDLFGAAATWARPPEDEDGRDQATIETFYRVQLTDNLQLTPALHLTFRPSYNPDRDIVWVASVVRIRFTL